MYFALARWVWDTSDSAHPHWRPPAGAVACLDIRNLAAQATQGGTGALSLFGFNTDPGSGVLGDDPLGLLGSVRRTALQNALGGVTLDAPRLGGAIWEALTRKANPDGSTGVRPILPGRTRRRRLAFGPIDLNVAFDLSDPDEAPNVLAVLREDYRAIRARALAAGTLRHRKVLGFWCRKFRTLQYRQFQPDDLPDEEPIDPETTQTDSFTRSDGSTVATGAPVTWTETSGWSISSNHLFNASAGGAAFDWMRCDDALSADDHYSQILTVGNQGGRYGVTVRHDASTINTNYNLFNDTSAFRLEKAVGGGFTQLDTSTIVRQADETLKLDVNGSELRFYHNGVLDTSIGTSGVQTDTSITGNLHCGLISLNTGDVTLDDWEASDGAAAGSTIGSGLLTGLKLARPRLVA